MPTGSLTPLASLARATSLAFMLAVSVAAPSCALPDNSVETRGVQPETFARITSARGTFMRTLRPPSVLRVRDRKVLAYEVAIVQPPEGQSFSIERMDISAGSFALTPLDAATIAASMVVRGEDNRVIQPAPATVAAGQVAVVYVLHELANDSSVTDNLLVAAALRYGDGRTETVNLDIPVVPVASVVLGPPLRGGPWLAVNALSNTSRHRRSMPVTPYLRVPERYAIDYVLADDAGVVARLPGTKNEDFLCYGQDVIAGGNGVITRAKNGVADNAPGVSIDPATINLDTQYGNMAVLSLDGGGHVVYGHLKPETLKIKVGDRVKKGDVIGQVGNSGDSTTPHLHIHVADRLDELDKDGNPVGSEGVPFVFDRFTFVGKPGYERFGERRITWGPRGNELQELVLPTEGEANAF